jgi:DNA-binding response OmpR family regulator
MTISKNSRILCVDNDEDICSMLTVLLKSSGYIVITAKSISEALELAQSEHFELYILDGSLPDGHGIDLCRQIRVLDPKTPILFYSASTRNSDRQAALESGAQAFIAKPDALDELETTILRLLA